MGCIYPTPPGVWVSILLHTLSLATLAEVSPTPIQLLPSHAAQPTPRTLLWLLNSGHAQANTSVTYCPHFLFVQTIYTVKHLQPEGSDLDQQLHTEIQSCVDSSSHIYTFWIFCTDESAHRHPSILLYHAQLDVGKCDTSARYWFVDFWGIL